MAYNGSGTFSLVAGNPVVTGTTISSTWANNTLSDIATGLSTAICKDGQTTVTANLPMGGFKHTGVALASSLTDYARLDQTQNNGSTTLTSVAGTDTITATATPTPAAYVAGQVFRLVPANTNTGATTLNISSLGAGAVQLNGAALVGGEVRQNIPLEVFVSTSTPVFEIIGNGAMVTTAATQTLTNKTISAASNTINLTPITASLGGDVALNNTSNYFDGPSIAQGASGTWFVSGTVTLLDGAGAAGFSVKLWDGTTVIAEAQAVASAINASIAVSLSGYIASPAGNLRISAKDGSSTSGIMRFNGTGSGNNKTSTITAIRIA